MKKKFSFSQKRSEGGGWQIGAEVEMTGMDAERNETKRKGQMRRGNERSEM